MAGKSSVTYDTISTDIERFHKTFDEVVQVVKTDWLGAEVPMFINGELLKAEETFSQFCPADTRLLLCKAQKGTVGHVRSAIAAAKAAFPAWSNTPWQERAAIIRRVADTLDENSLDLAALMTFEVGKGRLGALGEIQRSGELMRYYANSLEKNQGFVNEMGKMDANDPKEHNFSVLRPYGVWVVISPFNFPVSLTMGPVAAALLTGNVVVFKGSSDTPYIGWKLAELFSRAGFPPGVFNFVSGRGSVVGQELIDNPGMMAGPSPDRTTWVCSSIARHPRVSIPDL
jgi:1-pyrroline-5-carboxylate dehydrogenase